MPASSTVGWPNAYRPRKPTSRPSSHHRTSLTWSPGRDRRVAHSSLSRPPSTATTSSSSSLICVRVSFESPRASSSTSDGNAHTCDTAWPPRTSNSTRVFVDEPTRDDLQAKGLVSALEDGEHAGVHEVATDRVLLGVAHPPVDLHGFARHPLRGPARVGLGHRRLECAFAGAHQARDLKGELSRRLDDGGHRAELDARELVVQDRTSEHDAVPRVLQRRLVGGLHDADRARRRLEASVLEARHLEVEPPTESGVLTHQVLVGHEPVVEADLVGVHPAIAERVDRSSLEPSVRVTSALTRRGLVEAEPRAVASGLLHQK